MAGDCPGTRQGKAMGLDKSTQGRDETDDLCSVVVRACREEGTTRQKARRKNTNITPQRLRRACGTKRAGGRGTGRSKRTDERPRVAQKRKENGKATKNNTNSDR